jgi:hypothetical protein
VTLEVSLEGGRIQLQAASSLPVRYKALTLFAVSSSFAGCALASPIPSLDKIYPILPSVPFRIAAISIQNWATVEAKRRLVESGEWENIKYKPSGSEGSVPV